MAIDRVELLRRRFDRLTREYTDKDSILYALGVGFGIDPLDENSLAFVYEDGLKVLPSMAAVLADPGFWVQQADTGIDWVNVLHAGQTLVVHRPLPARGRVTATTRVTDVIDKGTSTGALIVCERTVRNDDNGEPLATLTSTLLARGDGGFSRARRVPTPKPDPMPQRPPDEVVDLPTPTQAALIYRLSGDFNPIHVSPGIARKAGFSRPILHGLCTFGVACHALVKSVCAYQPARLRRMGVRFSAPVYPGETIRTHIWHAQDALAFVCTVVERDVVVINNGSAEAGLH